MTLHIPLVPSRRIPAQFDYALLLDFVNGEYWRDRHEYVLSSMPGYVFARTGEQGAIDSAGNVAWFAANVPAINDRGYHCYGALTNFIMNSSAFGSWSINDVIVTADAQTAPDGTLTGDRVADDGDLGSATSYVSQTVAFAATGTKTLMIFAKDALSDWFVLQNVNFTTNPSHAYFDADAGVKGTTAGALSSSIEAVANDWQKCVMTFDPGADFDGAVRVRLADANDDASITRDGTHSLNFWHAQVVAGNFPNGGPLIRTTGAAASLGASDLELGAALPSGDFLAWAAVDVSVLATVSAFEFSTAGGGTSNEAIRMELTSAGGVRCNIITAGGVAQPAPITLSTLAVGRNVVMLRRRDGIFSIAHKAPNGTVSISADASGVATVPAVTAVDIGCTRGGASQINGKVEGFYQRDGTFSDAEITAILEAA